jgi:phosphoglycolate phosphatase-like HAD superfamily hydrolase
MFKNIFFDWSGVIQDSMKSHLWIINEIFAKYGAKPLSVEEIRENWEQPFMLFYNKYLPNLSFDEEMEAYKEMLLRKDRPRTNAFIGIVELIQQLKSEKRFMAIISSELEKEIATDVKAYGLENMFDDIASNIYDKTETLRDLIKNRQINPEESCFIGDSNHEIVAGKANGVKTIAVTWGFSTEQKLKRENPDFIAHDAEELKKIIF